ncbi:NADH-quinone oxidoreductase subunit A [Hydrogenophilus thermoluteolus]|jgi:NADH-quinone oxidoreductase subunit A|uniref:NADH-quinone oxidoreductase subunit A n=1 Tax=Hydrogenophilus thermoluteolus TaxID=297 RepID=UPI000EDA3A59|nr:NADH-quinone oxidoreductase subunit A [Hydrogenophilus thermoluteolus]MBW7655771.1 NADH-quinone oxidoreductase subunit A [Hydrogenophilus thermoluteolus]GLW59679.1 NADH-quinone oxidoreductase subunit A [Hydrogenophilus thermoluteolus]HCO77421.1 NADH-quinone oxidoreductase subunit A [Rhodocyclaceae bacterium]HNQ47821.1 NADH-quinone oxidoreductase subunit A [Hydrogenophilus thermoluteolus]
MESYFPVLVFLVVALAIGVLPMVFGWILGPRRPDPEKYSPYECGFEPFEDARIKFDVRYYLIAILFILFDLEIALLFPWGVTFNEMIAAGANAWYAFTTVLIFLAVLVLGYAVEWKNGALDWE